MNTTERKPTEKDIPDFIKNSGMQWFLTGSVAFGCQSHTSDIDIAVTWCDRKMWSEIITSNCFDVIDSQYNDSIKGTATIKNPNNTVSHFTINIIPLHNSDYLAWFLTTKMITDCKIFQPINFYVDKVVRLSIFQTLIAMNKLAFTRFNKYGNIEKFETVYNIIKEFNEAKKIETTVSTETQTLSNELKNLFI